MQKTLDTPYVYYELQDDLLIGIYKKNLKITLAIAKEIVETRLKFTDNQPVLALAYNAGVVRFDKAARDFLASDEGVKGVIAGAVVQENFYPVGVFFINFYLSVAKPKVPARFFTTKQGAIRWLQKFRKLHTHG
jgi:hypothetical protein